MTSLENKKSACRNRSKPLEQERKTIGTRDFDGLYQQ